MQLPNIHVMVRYVTDTSPYNLMGFSAHRSEFPSMTDEEIRMELDKRYTYRFEEEQGHTVIEIRISFSD